MTYEAWRISYQSAEQAARAAYRRAEELAAKLAEREGQEPVFWYRPCCDGEMYEGPIHNAQIERVRRLSGAWVPLFAISAEPVNARLLQAVKNLLSWIDDYAETSDPCFPAVEKQAQDAIAEAEKINDRPAGGGA